jgi:hypothetical protein
MLRLAFWERLRRLSCFACFTRAPRTAESAICYPSVEEKEKYKKYFEKNQKTLAIWKKM